MRNYLQSAFRLHKIAHTGWAVRHKPDGQPKSQERRTGLIFRLQWNFRPGLVVNERGLSKADLQPKLRVTPRHFSVCHRDDVGRSGAVMA